MDDHTAQRVGANVRAELARRKTSQAAIAVVLGMSQAAVSRRLNGTVPFGVDELSRVAATLDVPLSRLIQDAPTAVGVA